MIDSMEFLLDAGYATLEYLGGGDIQPERDLLPEDLGIYMRTQRWSVISDSTVPSLETIGKKEVDVAAVDATMADEGNKGGTKPVSG